MSTRGFSVLHTPSPILLCFAGFSSGGQDGGKLLQSSLPVPPAAPAWLGCLGQSAGPGPAGWAPLPAVQLWPPGCRTVSPAGRTRRGRAAAGAGGAVSPRRAGCCSRSRFPGELSSDLRISIFDALLLAY